MLACLAVRAARRAHKSNKRLLGWKAHRALLLVLGIAPLTALSAQTGFPLLPPEDPSTTTTVTAPATLELTYVRPTERTRVNNYLFDTFGPYPIAGSAFAAGIDQLSDAPPEWDQRAEGFGKRFGSDFAIAAIGTTTRYGLAAAFKEDTLYYRCQCAGPLPRLRHAIISTLIGRRGKDGHRVFSFSALAAPYTGSMIAVYAWYPNRFGAKDAFRMGNYSLLGDMGGNIALEFFYSGPHALISRMHLNNKHGSAVKGPNP